MPIVSACDTGNRVRVNDDGGGRPINRQPHAPHRSELRPGEAATVHITSEKRAVIAKFSYRREVLLSIVNSDPTSWFIRQIAIQRRVNQGIVERESTR